MTSSDGAAPEGQASHVRYFRVGGGVAEIDESEPGISSIPEGAEEITREQYEAELAALRASHEAYLAELREAELERARGDYEALRAAGIGEETARRLSGYTGEG